MADQALIDRIAKDPELDDATRMHLLSQVDPDFPKGVALPKPTGPALQQDTLTPAPSTPQLKPQQDGTGYLGSIARGVLRAPGMLIAPGLAASEALLTKMGLIDPTETPRTDAATGTRPQSEAEAAINAFVPERLLPPPTRVGPRIAERMAEEVTMGSPWLRAAKAAGRLTPELLTQGAAGMGAGIAQQVSPDNAVAEVLGQLSGYGAAGTLGAARRLMPRMTDEQATQQMHGILGSQIGDKALAAQQAGQAQRLGLEFPGFSPTLGMATNDPGLMAIETAARAKSPQIESKVRLRLERSRSALAKGLNTLDEPMPESLGMMGAGVESKARQPLVQYQETVLKARQDMDARLNNIAQQFNERTAALNPRTRDEAGDLLIHQLTQAKEEARATAEALYRQVQGTDERIVTLKPITDSITAMRKEVNPAELTDANGVSQSFPQDVAAHIERLAESGKGETTFETLRGLRRTVGHALDVEAAKLAPDKVLRGRLERLQASVESAIDENIANRFSVEEMSALSTANSFYRNDVIRKFNQGPVATLWRAGAHGEPSRLKPSKGVTTFFHGGVGAAEDARALKTALGAQGTDAFREAALSDLYTRAANTDGTLIPASFDRWMRTYRDALKEFPSVHAELSNLQKAQATLKTLGKAVEKMPDAMRQPDVLESEAARLFIGRPVDLAVKDLLKDPKPLQRVAEFDNLTKGDPMARLGLRDAIWKELKSQMGLTAPVGTSWTDQTKSVAEIIAKHKPLLETLYPPEHLQTLKRIAQGEDILARSPESVKMANAQLSETSGLAKAAGTFWSRTFAVFRGVVGEPFIMTEAMSRLMVKAMEGISLEKQQAIVEHAILDPNLMRTMEGLAKGWSPNKVNQELSLWLKNASKRAPILGAETRQNVFYLPPKDQGQQQ